MKARAVRQLDRLASVPGLHSRISLHVSGGVLAVGSCHFDRCLHPQGVNRSGLPSSAWMTCLRESEFEFEEYRVSTLGILVSDHFLVSKWRLTRICEGLGFSCPCDYDIEAKSDTFTGVFGVLHTSNPIHQILMLSRGVGTCFSEVKGVLWLSVVFAVASRRCRECK